MHEVLYIDRFRCYSWFSVLMTHLAQASCRSLVSTTSVADVIPAPTNNSSYIGRVMNFYFVFVFVFVHYCMGVNGLEAANA